MTLLKHLNNEKSAQAETSVMQYSASHPASTSLIPGHLIHTITRPALLLVLLIFSSFYAFAYDCKVDGIYYNLNNDDKTASVTSSSINNKYVGTIIIPESITYSGTTYSVTSIGDFAFSLCSGLTSVTIGNSVTSIGGFAFNDCSGLTSVTIPNSVTSIGDSAFQSCSGLTSVTIGNSVTSIGDSAFHGCSGLTSVTVDKNNGKYDSRDNCNAIIDTSTNTLIVGCKNTIIPNSVTSIGRFAFHGCSGLTSVTIGNSVTSIGDGAFYGCSGLTSVTVDKNNGTYDSRNNCNAIIDTSTNKLIVGCKNTTIPNSVTSIDSYAFGGCSGLTSVTIPNSVTSIGEGVFSGCSGLTSVFIPNSVTSIGRFAFHGCSGLTSVTIPNSVTSIGDFAFSRCSRLTSVTIPNSVTSIGDSAFGGCTGLTSVTIGNSVTSIGDDVFNGCSGLTSVTIPNSVTSIGDRAFYYCSGLTSVTIPNSVTSIGDRAFQGCSGLTSVTIGNSVTSIGSWAFNSIGLWTFNGCSRLTKLVSLAVEPPTCGEGVFEKVDKTTCQLLVPEESINKYKTADQWKEFLNILGYNGVDDVSVDTPDALYEVYNLQGVRVGGGMREEEVTADVLPHGVYILVSPQGRKKLKI